MLSALRPGGAASLVVAGLGWTRSLVAGSLSGRGARPGQTRKAWRARALRVGSAALLLSFSLAGLQPPAAVDAELPARSDVSEWRPDLVVQGGSARIEDDLWGWLRIGNRGGAASTQAATASSRSQFGLSSSALPGRGIRSTDHWDTILAWRMRRDTHLHVLARFSVGSLGAGEGRTIRFRVRVPDGAVMEDRLLVVCADAATRIGERSERNNCRTIAHGTSSRPFELGPGSDGMSGADNLLGQGQSADEPDWASVASTASAADARTHSQAESTRTAAIDTSIVSGPSGSVPVRTASLSFSSTEAGSSFECKLDGGAYGVCASPKAYSSLLSGSHTFSVRAIDAVGNVDGSPATRTWIVDVTAPSTTLTAGPTGSVSATSASFAFSSTETGVAFECKLDAASFAACSTPVAFGGLAEGAHTFAVRAVERGGQHRCVTGDADVDGRYVGAEHHDHVRAVSDELARCGVWVFCQRDRCAV